MWPTQQGALTGWGLGRQLSGRALEALASIPSMAKIKAEDPIKACCFPHRGNTQDVTILISVQHTS
jgi:hypothetical protein